MISSVICVVVGITTVILAAPVAQNKNKDSLSSQIRDQEQALETLAAKSQKGIVPQSIQLARTYSYSNINGAEKSQNKFEQAVLDPEKEGVISDLKEKLTEAKASPDSPIHKSFKASLDVPPAGIHKEISDSDSESEEQSEDFAGPKDTVEFTPKAVAEYLVRTGEMDEFKMLLNELVEASEISSEDAENYEKNVMDEYFKLAQELPTKKGTAEDQPSYMPAGNQPLYPGFNDVEQNEVYPLYGYGQDPMKANEEARMDMYINYLMNRPVTLDEMISSLMDEWLTRAIISGDPEAEEILSNIVDYVTRDDNPNDEEQVRAILGDIFAEALLEDLTPRVDPQNLPDVEGIPPAQETNKIEKDLPEVEDEKEEVMPDTKAEQMEDLVHTETETDEEDERPKN